MSRVVVLGGAGAMGQVIVRDLAESSDFDEVVIADFDKARAEALASRLGNGKLRSAFADINDAATLSAVLKDTDVIINSTPYYFNVRVMEAALESGCHYMDLGGLFHVTREQQKLDQQFKDRNLVAILGMGAAPGMTNVMAAAAAKQLDKVESIDIVIGCVDFVKVDHPLATPYALDTILDEYTKQPMVFENGKFLAKPPMSGEVKVDFAQPVGACSAILTLHSEVATLPETYASQGVKNVTFRLGLPADFHDKLKLLVDIGLGGSEKISVEGTQVTPRKVLAKLLEQFTVPQTDPDDCEVVRVDVKGTVGNQSKLIRMETTVLADKRWKVSCGALDTGVPPAIAAQMILSGDVASRGVLAPEVCIDHNKFFAELAKRAINIEQHLITEKDAIASAAR